MIILGVVLVYIITISLLKIASISDRKAEILYSKR